MRDGINIFGLALILLILPSSCSSCGKKNLYHERETKILNETERRQISEKYGGSFIKLSDGYTHYELSGPANGESVVLVHGATLPMWSWDKQVPFLVKAGYRVLRYDEYGKGFSSKPVNIKYGKELFNRQLEELIEQLDIKLPVHLVGTSFGGGIITVYAYRNPEKVNKLVYVAPGTSGLRGLTRLFFRSCLGRYSIKKQLEEQVQGQIDKTFKEVGIPIEPYARIFKEQSRYKGFQYSLIALFEGDGVDDKRPLLKKLNGKKDMMLVWGSVDQTVPKREMENFLKAAPQSQYYELEGVSHALPTDGADQFNSLLLNFLKAD